MVKKAPEDLSGRLFRARLNPIEIPSDLGEPERVLFASILKAQPPDWFSAGSLPLLRRYVKTSIATERLHAAYDAEAIDSPEAANFWRQIVQGNQSLGSLAARLRLSVQVTMSARSTGRMSERSSGLDEDLLGPPPFVGRNGGNGSRVRQ